MSLAAAKDEPSVEPLQADCIREATPCRRQVEGVRETTFCCRQAVVSMRWPFRADGILNQMLQDFRTDCLLISDQVLKSIQTN